MDFGELLQLVLEMAITVLLPIFLGFAIVAVRGWWESIKAKIPQEQYAFADMIARQLVLAAEQNGLAGKLSNEASVKYDWVLDNMERQLREAGIKLDLHTLSNMIESAVKAELNMERTSAEG